MSYALVAARRHGQGTGVPITLRRAVARTGGKLLRRITRIQRTARREPWQRPPFLEQRCGSEETSSAPRAPSSSIEVLCRSGGPGDGRSPEVSSYKGTACDSVQIPHDLH